MNPLLLPDRIGSDDLVSVNNDVLTSDLMRDEDILAEFYEVSCAALKSMTR